jgi:NADH-ubiquinone oxidoreductase chain 2
MNKVTEQFKIIEYSLIILFILTGGIFLVSSNDLISMFLSIELQSYGLYLLCSIYRNSELSVNAGLTYFLLGGLSSCIILLGQSLLYINAGSTSLDNIYLINNIVETFFSFNFNLDFSTYRFFILNLDEYFIQLSLITLSIGFLFKISAAPFHFWSPDVYDAIPTIVTTFVAIIAKITIFMLFFELVYYTSLSIYTWKISLMISSFLSLITGSILGLTQFRIKRLLAFSTISHVGFILLALSINSIESIQAFYFYIIQYSITNLNAFLILISIGYTFNLVKNFEISSLNLKEKGTTFGTKFKSNYISYQINTLSPVQFINQLKGFFYLNPILAISFGITIYSFVGIPPLIGFFAKQMILSAALDNGYIFMSLIAILTSVIGGVYYLGIIKELFFENTPMKDNINKETNIFILSSSLALSVTALTFMILWFIFIPKEILNLTLILGLF